MRAFERKNKVKPEQRSLFFFFLNSVFILNCLLTTRDAATTKYRGYVVQWVQSDGEVERRGRKQLLNGIGTNKHKLGWVGTRSQGSEERIALK